MISCIPVNFQNFIVIFLLWLFLLLLSLFDLRTHIGSWIELLYLTVIHHCRSVFSSFHIQISPPYQRFVILRIQLKRFVKIVKSFEGFLSLHKCQGTIWIYDCVELFVWRIEINSFWVLLFSFFVFPTFYQLVSLLLKLLALLSRV